MLSHRFPIRVFALGANSVDNQRRGPNLCRFETFCWQLWPFWVHAILIRDAVVADERVGEHQKLTGIARVGQGLKMRTNFIKGSESIL